MLSWKKPVKFHVTIDRDKDGVWIVECPAIPGCVSDGSSGQEALENIKEAVELCREARAERGTLRSQFHSAGLTFGEFTDAANRV
jgi:predicted RNase H-like HicB family nuclease